MTQNLNPVDVAAWMRGQAQQFTKMAEQIESTFKLNGQAKGAPTPGPEQKPALSSRIVQLLKDGTQRRASTIAQELGATENDVNLIVNANDELHRNERGWIRIYYPLKGGDA